MGRQNSPHTSEMPLHNIRGRTDLASKKMYNSELAINSSSLEILQAEAEMMVTKKRVL